MQLHLNLSQYIEPRKSETAQHPICLFVIRSGVSLQGPLQPPVGKKLDGIKCANVCTPGPMRRPRVQAIAEQCTRPSCIYSVWEATVNIWSIGLGHGQQQARKQIVCPSNFKQYQKSNKVSSDSRQHQQCLQRV